MRIQWKILLSATVTTAVVFAGASLLVTTRFEQWAEKRVLATAQETAYRHGQAVEARLNQLMVRVEMLRQVFRNLHNVPEPDRSLIDDILIDTSTSDEAILGAWTYWEPNAFDNRDPQYAKIPGRDDSGRINAYWYQVEGDAVFELNDEHTLDLWYKLPAQTKRAILTDPYHYSLGGTSILVVSALAPILQDGQFLGVVGIDLRLDVLQSWISQLKLHDQGTSALLSGNLTYVAHTFHEFVGKSVQELIEATPTTDIDLEEVDRAIAAAQAGQIFTFFTQRNFRGGASYLIGTPVSASEASQPWSFVVSVPESQIRAITTQFVSQGALVVLVVLLLLSIVLAWISRRIAGPISHVAKQLRVLALGKTDGIAPIDCNSRDEVEDISNSFNSLLHSYDEVQAVAGAIARGDFSQTLQPRSLDDALAKSINEMAQQRQCAEAQLRKLSQAVEQSPSIAYITDTLGHLQYVNAMFCQVNEVSADAVIGQQPKLLSYDEERPQDYAQVWDALNNGRSWQGEVLCRTASGRDFWVSGTVAPLRDEQGEITHFVAVEEDITERKAAEERFRGLLEAAPDAMVIINREGQIVMVNRQAINLFQYSREELLQLKVEALVPQQVRDAHQGMRRGYASEPVLREMGAAQDLKGVRKDGVEFPIEVSLSPVETPDGLLVFSTVRDVTERKQAQEALLQAQQAAEEANKAKSQFLANMSHEIRTPMNAIIGLTHLALDTELDSKQHDYLVKIRTSANALLGLINDILDFSKIEAGKLDLETVDFDLHSEVLENLTTVIGMKAGEKGLELLYDFPSDIPSDLEGDPLRLGQVLINLLNNAVKFTDQGQITLHIRVVEQTAGQICLRFEVQDTGIGMTEAQLSRMFQSFSQADTSTTRKYGGTGLGLAISKRLVEMMGGEIGVDSVYGEGTRFWFTARLGFSPAPVATRQPVARDSLAGMRVLVVDDNPTARIILERYLASFGFKVTLSGSGSEALKLIHAVPEEEAFDLVLMDWKMPEMDGVETARAIQSDGMLPKVPEIIMATAYDRGMLQEEASDLVLDGFLTKPVSQSALLNSILNAFGEETAVRTTSDTSRLADKVRGARLLLVEDNEMNQMVARELLEKEQVEVVVVDDGKQGVEAVQAEAFDGVLMDVQMPIMDGYEATRQIRKLPGCESLPIIAMTAGAMSGDRDKALAAGMNDHVTKPIDVRELFDVLANWITATHPLADTPSPPEQTSAPTKAEQSLPLLEGIDTQAGLQRVGGNVHLYRKMLGKFPTSQGQTVPAIRQALQQGDVATAERLAHTLKGLAGNLGATALQGCAEGLEKRLKSEDAAEGDIKEALLALDQSLQQVLGAIASMSDTSTPISPGEAAKNKQADDVPEAVHGAIQALAAYLADSDAQATDCFEQHRDDFKAHFPPAALNSIAEHLDNYDFEAAAEVLQEISGKAGTSL